MTGETEHKYPLSYLLGDYASAAFGVAIMILLFTLASFHYLVLLFMLALTAVFLIFGARTYIRHNTVIKVDDVGVRAVGLLPKQMPWAEISELDLRYFSTRRDRRRGWMQLRLKSGKKVLRIESQIDDFESVARRAYDKCAAEGAAMNVATMANLKSMGIGPQDDLPPARGDFAG